MSKKRKRDKNETGKQNKRPQKHRSNLKRIKVGSLSSGVNAKIAQMAKDIQSSENPMFHAMKTLEELRLIVPEDPIERAAKLYGALLTAEKALESLQDKKEPLTVVPNRFIPPDDSFEPGSPSVLQLLANQPQRVSVSRPAQQLWEYIGEHNPKSCRDIPMMIDCGLTKADLVNMDQEDALTYHIVIRCLAYFLSITNFRAIDNNPTSTYTLHHQIGVFIMMSYLLRRRPAFVNPAEQWSDREIIQALKILATKILAFTNLQDSHRVRAMKFIKNSCMHMWRKQTQLRDILTQILASYGASMSVIQSLLDCSLLHTKKPKWRNPRHKVLCAMSNTYIDGKDAILAVPMPMWHTQESQQFFIHKQFADPLRCLFIRFNIWSLLTHSPSFLLHQPADWISAFVAVYRFSEENSIVQVVEILQQLTLQRF